MRHPRWRGAGLVLALGLAAGSACSQTGNQPHTTSPNFSSRQIRVSGEYLITLAAGADTNAIPDLYGQFGIKGIKALGDDVYLVTITNDPGPATIERLGWQNTTIKKIQPSYVYRAQ